ncbi:MAG TPA: sensor histidine kinase [Actinomycetes bacterium]
MSARSWQLYLCAGAALVTAYFLLPPDPARLLVWPAIGLSSAAAIVLGVRWNRPSRPAAWYLFAAGQLFLVVGDFLYFLRNRVLHLTGPAPYFADVLYLAMYPALVAGLLLLIRQRRPGRDRASLLDATVIAAGMGLLAWVFLIDPYVDNPDLSLVDRLVSIAYPLGDVLLLAVAVRLAVGPGRRPPAFWLLALSTGSLLVGDVVYGLRQLAGTWQPGSPIDLCWLLFYLCWGAAALHPSMRALPERSPAGSRLTRNRLAVLAAASLVAPAVLVIQDLRGQPIEAEMIAVVSVVVFLLTLVRMADLAAELALQDQRKRVMQTVLRATDEQRRRLAADLHDGPVQGLAALGLRLSRLGLRLRGGDAEGAEALLGDLEQRLAGEIAGLRRLVAELRPPVLDQFGLETALRRQVETFQADSGVDCEVETDLGRALAPELETVLYRVTRESLANVGKHANAAHVRIWLAADNGLVRLRISDDGVGFDMSQQARLAAEGHFGLAGMRERVEMVGGRFLVESRLGEGTTISVQLHRRGRAAEGGSK